MKDDLGEFKIRCRRFTWAEQDRLIAFNRELSCLDNKDKHAVAAANKQFFGLLAYPCGVCLDKALNMDFWEKGNYSQDLPKQILLAVRSQSSNSEAAAQNFRPK